MRVVVFGAAGWLGRAVLQNFKGKYEIRAFDHGSEAWDSWNDLEGEWQGGEKVDGDIASFKDMQNALKGVDCVVHTAVYFPGSDAESDNNPFLVNLKGLWNVLEGARRQRVKRVVHIGSCQTVHPEGIFFSADVRRPDASLYAVTKRLQEEMCRQFYEAFGLSVIVLRPDYIVDSLLGIGRSREKLGAGSNRRRNGWVCRHDLAEACRLSLENKSIVFDIFHIVGTGEANKTCNVARSRDILGLTYKGNLDQYR